MTEKLKTLMDRAADRDFDAVDLAAIVESGERAVRRRRTTLLGGVAALAVVAGGLTLALGGGESAKDDAPVVGALPPEVSWVVGETLHTPSASYDLGRKAEVYVRTAVGYAFVDDEGTVFSLVDGKVARIGTGAAGQSPLVGDENGSLVGWVDRSGAVPAYVTADLATGATQRHDQHLDASMAGGEPPRLAWFYAIDDATAYWLDLRGLVATDLVTRESRVLAAPDDVRWIGDVTDGLRVQLIEDADGGDTGTELVRVDGQAALAAVRGRYLGAVSTDGRWVTTADGSVVEVATGEERPLSSVDLGGDAFGYEWLDDDTAVVLVDRPDGVALLTCEVPRGACTTVTSGVAPDGLVLPVGGYLTDMVSTVGEESSATGTAGARATD